MRLDPIRHRHWHSFGRTGRPGLGEPFDRLINNVKDILTLDIQTRLKPCEVVAEDLRQPRRTEEGQAQVVLAGVDDYMIL